MQETRLYAALSERYVHNLKAKVLDPFLENENFRRAIKAFHEEEFRTHDRKIQSDVRFLVANLCKNYGYTEQGAQEVCVYAIDNDLARKFPQNWRSPGQGRSGDPRVRAFPPPARGNPPSWRPPQRHHGTPLTPFACSPADDASRPVRDLLHLAARRDRSFCPAGSPFHGKQHMDVSSLRTTFCCVRFLYNEGGCVI